MKVLLGTTNSSKVKRFADLLKGYDIEFITLKDIKIIEEPEEKGDFTRRKCNHKGKVLWTIF